MDFICRIMLARSIIFAYAFVVDLGSSWALGKSVRIPFLLGGTHASTYYTLTTLYFQQLRQSSQG
ncbi:hypothetical protein EV127DRAFT_416240 [Xylaria flabelliformis]|nr:hypothetical protein EV127DRAFT_416240 [Xylaria flabelliformis]